MTVLRHKMSALLLLTEGLEQTVLQFKGHLDCSDKSHGLDWCCLINTGVIRSSQACTFRDGVFTLGADGFEHFRKTVRLSSIRWSDC